MPRVKVTLYAAQYATVEVDAPEDASDADLTQRALRALDASGGAEWWTESGWIEMREWLDPI